MVPRNPLDVLFGKPGPVAPRLGVYGGPNGGFDVLSRLTKTPNLFAVAKGRAPLMVVRGRTDSRVKREGHGVAKSENHLRFRAAAGWFLARCFGGRCA